MMITVVQYDGPLFGTTWVIHDGNGRRIGNSKWLAHALQLAAHLAAARGEAMA